MKLKGDTYRRAFTKWRELREKEISELKREVYELNKLVEWLCHEVIKDE